MACLLLAAAFPVVAFHQVVLGSHTLQTSTLAGITSTNGFDDIVAGADRVGTTLRPDAGASAWQTEPWAKTISRAYRDGTWPLWNPYQGAGKPMAANTISAALDPLSLAVFVRPSPRVADLSIVGAFSLGSMAMFLFLRSLRTRRVAALASAAVFSFGGYWFFNANNLFSRSYIYVPILLFLVNKSVEAGIGPWTFALALALTGSIVVGMPESTFLVLVVIVVYALYRLLTQLRGHRGVAWLNLAVAGGLGLAMAAPLIVLFGEYERLSFHTHKSGSPLGQVSDPRQYLMAWLTPNLGGTVTKAWVGGAAVALAGLCAAASSRFLRARQVLPFGLLTGFFVWKIYGLPGAHAFGGLPIVEQVKWATFGIPILQTLLAVLAGIGLDALLRRQIVPRRTAYVGIAFVAVVALLVLTSVDVRVPLRNGDGIDRLVPALAGVGVVAVAVFATRERARRATVGVVVALVLVAELVVLFPTQSLAPRTEPFVDQPWFSLVEPASDAVQTGPGPSRVFGLDAKLFPETASAVGIYDVRMLDALYVDRYYRYVKTFLDGGIYDRYVGMDHFSPETGTQYVDNPMFDLLGVRYLLSGWSVPASVDDGSGNGRTTRAQYRFVGRDNLTSVWENLDARPRAFVVHDVEHVGDQHAARRRMLRGATKLPGGAHRVGDFDPFTTAVVEGDAKVPTKPCATPARVSFAGYEPGEVRLVVDADCPGLLVLTDTYYPGWTATVDGDAADVRPTDLAFRGVAVPAGRSVVVMRYQATHFRLALLVAGLAFLVGVGIAFTPMLRSRRSARRNTRKTTPRTSGSLTSGP